MEEGSVYMSWGDHFLPLNFVFLFRLFLFVFLTEPHGGTWRKRPLYAVGSLI